MPQGMHFINEDHDDTTILIILSVLINSTLDYQMTHDETSYPP